MNIYTFMTKVDVVTIDGSKNGMVSLRKIRPASSIMISNSILANLSNKRTARAHTKTRAEVSGGGKKPWRQKGTGQARAGSSRSPLWTGGGVTFGPRSERNFYKRVNRKQKLIVINSLLAESAEAGNFKIIEKIDLPLGKTKEMMSFLSLMGIDGTTILVLDKEFSTSSEAEKVYNSGRNISFLTITTLEKLNTFMLLKNKWILFTKKAFEDLSDRLEVLKEEKTEKEKEVKKEIREEIQEGNLKEIGGKKLEKIKPVVKEKTIKKVIKKTSTKKENKK